MKKLTKLEKYWILYDVGNSAFVLLLATIIPIYYKNIAQAAGVSDSDSTAYFGYIASAATLIVAILGPTLGSVADRRRWKKPFFIAFMVLGALGCAALALAGSWVSFLGVILLARVGLNTSIVFYDSMLVDVTDNDRVDQVSAHGYAWGYIGSCIPFVISLLLVLQGESLFGISMAAGIQIAFLLNAVWWVLVTLPLLRNYKQKFSMADKEEAAGGQASAGKGLEHVRQLWADLKQDKRVLLFLAAFFFYIDGVYTIIEMATTYGKDVGIDDTSMLLALLLTQVVAFPFAILFGRLTKKYAPGRLIGVCVLAYFGIAVFALFLVSAWQFWLLATCVGVFQGAIQALSRSYFAKIIPKEKSSEYFGIFDVFGKGASFTGTLVMGLSTQLFDTSRAGVCVLALMFLIGLAIFQKQDKMGGKKA